jgi:hypothetical protein
MFVRVAFVKQAMTEIVVSSGDGKRGMQVSFPSSSRLSKLPTLSVLQWDTLAMLTHVTAKKPRKSI